MPDSAASEILRTATLKLTDDGTLEGKVSLSFTGLEAISRRHEFYNQDDEARKKYLEELLKDYVPAASEVELTKQPEWKSSEAPLTAEFDIKIPGWASAAGHRVLIATGIFSAGEKHTFEHANRVNDVYFAYSFRTVDDVSIELPLDWKVDKVPGNIDQDVKAAQYTLKIEQKPGSIHITRGIRSDLLVVPKNAYPVLRDFYQAVKSGDEQQIVLQPGASAATN
jgi:hypothetical protein